MIAQTKKAIKNEVKRFLLGSSNNRRSIGEQKALRALRFGDHKNVKRSEDRFPLKVRKMMTPEARIAMRSSEEVIIGLVNYSVTKAGKPGGGEMSQQHKNIRAKLLRLSQAKGKKSEPAYMKSAGGFINSCSGPS